jgi:surface-anchored protein
MKFISNLFLVSLFIPATAHAASYLTAGHVDAIGIGFVGGELEPHSHASEGAVIDGVTLLPGEEIEAEPGELVIVAPVGSYVLRETGTLWAPVGVGAGEGFWMLPESEQPGIPFAGIGLEELDPAEWASALTLTLTGANLPTGAAFSFWQTDPFGDPTFFVSTVDGISAADTISLAAGSHNHLGWGFTKPGTYELTFEIEGLHQPDLLLPGISKTATATYSFLVVPEPTVPLLAVLGVCPLLMRRRRQGA